MPARTVHGIALSALVLGVLSMACDDIVTKTPTPPTAPAMNLMTVVGPTAIEPGQSIQWSANLNLADGTVKVASSDVITWRSSNPAVAQVSASGVVTSTGIQGDTSISARYIPNPFHSVSREIVVQPAGTFRLIGGVTEEGLGLGIPGARAELASGSPFTIANTTGQFRLYGLPPAADIRISANGYETRTFSLQLSGNVSRSFALPLTGGRPPVAGAYTLFVDAISCPSSSVPALSAGLQHRVYNAVLTQSGTQIAVKLGGAQFQTNSMNLGDSFTGSVIHGGVRFFLDFYIQYYFYDPTAVFYPAVAERLPDGTFLVTQGSINMTGAPDSGFSGAFSSGGMFLWDSKFPDRASRLIAGCSGQITLKLVPR